MRSSGAEAIEVDQASEEEMIVENKYFGDGIDYRTVIRENFYITWGKTSLLGESATLNYGTFQKDIKLLVHMFDVDIQTRKVPQTVILHGDAGVGKTMLLRKAMLEWAHGNLYQQFACVFYLNGKEISQMKQRSFAQLISKNWPSTEVPIEEILSEPNRLLFMIDSFDELDFSFEEPRCALCKDWTQKHPVSFLISSLLRKVMLPESFLIIATRTTALKRLEPLLQDHRRSVKLPGLSKNMKVDYIHHLLQDKTWAANAIFSIKKNWRLFNMCNVPQMCQVVCTCLKEQVEKGGDIATTCQTTTGLFTCYVCSLFAPIDGGSSNLPNETLLRSLCKAAVEGIWNMEPVLYRKNLRKHELTRDDITVFLDAKVLQKDTEHENCYLFTHLHIQEFFAALYYLLRENPEVDDYNPQPFEDLFLLFESSPKQDIHLEQTKCFLFGLLNKDRIQQLEETFNFTISLEIKAELLSCFEDFEMDGLLPTQLKFLSLLHYLYETQDEEFITMALHHFPKISVVIRDETELLICSFCLKYCHSLQIISLTIPTLRNTFDLDPTDENSLKEAGVRIIRCWHDLFSILHTNDSLREMDLNGSTLNEPLVKVLNEELCHPKCKLKRLLLGAVFFIDAYQDFSFLTSNYSLTHLDLKNTDFEGNGFETLCKALKSQQCKLRELRLESCSLNVHHCLTLAEALYTNRSLVFLNLSTNSIFNDGVASLFKVLTSPFCHLERLALASCGLTKDVCESLSSTLIRSKKLTHLCLADNSLENRGIKLLSNALKHPQCTLQSLVLKSCCFTSIGNEFLSAALLVNESLIHLDVGLNRLKDDGIKVMCHVLKQRTCKLQELGLRGCALTNESCRDLASVILNNSNLWILDLGDNILKDYGLSILCDALKNPNCHIQRLGLENCGLSSVCSQDLATLISNNQSLVQMNLVKNDFNYEAIRNLCKVLKSPACKLQFLALDEQAINKRRIKMFLNDVTINNPNLVICKNCPVSESGSWWQCF